MISVACRSAGIEVARADIEQSEDLYFTHIVFSGEGLRFGQCGL